MNAADAEQFLCVALEEQLRACGQVLVAAQRLRAQLDESCTPAVVRQSTANLLREIEQIEARAAPARSLWSRNGACASPRLEALVLRTCEALQRVRTNVAAAEIAALERWKQLDQELEASLRAGRMQQAYASKRLPN